MTRRINFQTIAWFWDLYQRELLELDPPYQRRSVWNQDYKDYFIDTVLNNYPAPAIFIYEEITSEGTLKYSIVDGKQRLSTVFAFAENKFPIYPNATIERFREKFFKDLEPEDKQIFWRYQFALEYLPSKDEQIISNIFDRINRNVMKLKPQELRHAKFNGIFITTAEDLTNWMSNYLDKIVKNKSLTFPNLNSTSRKQMKDVEIVAQLLLLLEEGAKTQNQDYLDKAFSDRDIEWEKKDDIEDEFRNTIKLIGEILEISQNKDINLVKTRLRNQADFYSLFGALAELNRQKEYNFDISPEMVTKIYQFLEIVKDEEKSSKNEDTLQYYKAVKFSFTDAGARKKRIEIMKSLIQANITLEES
ncbi:MAG: DUF262 domain-containing protein [Prochloron sp. SP5CPC1]|nr:DUF262 domain-containing protein [Candidatus Paraprochloron terpiosi SP5CPC1]